MTREEAITKFEKQLTSAMVVLDSGFGTRPGESDRLYRERKELAEIALSALRQQERFGEANKALTMDDLRKMDGEPVWVQSPGIPEYGRWAIVEGVGENCLFLHDDFTCHDYGKTWLAYRRKPEEDDHE